MLRIWAHLHEVFEELYIRKQLVYENDFWCVGYLSTFCFQNSYFHGREISTGNNLIGQNVVIFWHFFSIYDQNVSKYGVIMSRTQIKSLWTVCLAKFDRRKVSLFFSYLQNIGLISRNEDILYRLFWVFSRTYDYISKSCIEYLYYPKYFSMRKIFLVCLAYLESRIFYHQHLLIFWHFWNLEISTTYFLTYF